MDEIMILQQARLTKFVKHDMAVALVTIVRLLSATRIKRMISQGSVQQVKLQKTNKMINLAILQLFVKRTTDPMEHRWMNSRIVGRCNN